jgi:branched-chain amino acid transport system permease protein
VADVHVDPDEVTTERGRPARIGEVLRNPHARAGQWAALGLIGFLFFTQVLFPSPIGVLVQGAINGAIFSLTALGIVLIYRANRIINFAQGDLGAVGGLLGVLLIAGTHWPFFLAMFAGLAAALVLGALAEFLFVRRFSKAPRLILTVATLGIAQIFQGGEVTLPKAFGRDIAPQINSTPFDFWHFKLTDTDPIIFSGSYIIAVLTVAIVTVALTLFFRYTRIGIAVRGSAESAERAGQLGIPVKRIGTLVWMIAAGLSALSFFLQAPIAGIPLGVALGPALLLRALAAAVIGRMENLGVTFAAAIGIGVLEQSAKFATQRGTLGDAIVFAIIMAAFVFQKRQKITRADDSGASSWSLIKEVRPIPPELKNDPWVRVGIPAIGGVLLLALVLIPQLLPAIKVNLLFEQAVMFAIVGISLVVLTGWGGEVSLGQIAFFGLGAATAAKLTSMGWDFFLCIVAAGVVGAAFSLVIGIPSLRIRGPFLAVATLGLALTTSSFFLDPHYFPWFVVDNRVAVDRPLLFGKFDTGSEWTFYVVLLIALGLLLVSVRSFRRSRAGRVLIAARDNPRAAQLYGVSVVRARLWAFAMSGFIAAVGGGFFAFHQEGLSRTFFAANNSIIVFTLVVVGGLGSLSGALLGAAYYTTVQYAITSPLAFLFVQGLGLLIILLVLPGGLGGAVYDIRDALLRQLARRRGIVVASLLADRRTEDEMFSAAAAAGTADVADLDDDDGGGRDTTEELVFAPTGAGR